MILRIGWNELFSMEFVPISSASRSIRATSSCELKTVGSDEFGQEIEDQPNIEDICSGIFPDLS